MFRHSPKITPTLETLPHDFKLFQNISVETELMKSIFISDFKDIIDGYMVTDRSQIPTTFYPCVKYQIQADPVLDGTDTIYIAESMHNTYAQLDHGDRFQCHLIFTARMMTKCYSK